MKRGGAPKPITDDELEGVLSEIIRTASSADARIRAIRELRNLRKRRDIDEDEAGGGEFDDLDDGDELEPRRARRK